MTYIEAAVLLKDTYLRWREDEGPRLGAALSYYTTFSLAPLLLIAISIVGLVMGRDAAQGKVLAELTQIMGPHAARAVQNMIVNAEKPAAGTLATIIGIGSLFLGASGVMYELKRSLNKIWRVEPIVGIKAIIRDKLLSMAMVLAIGFLLLVSLLINALLSVMGSLFSYLLPLPEFFLQFLNFVVSFAAITVLFASIFKALPNARIVWRDVWIGAALTSFLFTLGKFFLGLYLGKGIIGSTYGTAGSVLVVLVWVYYSSQILYMGSEFTWLYAERFGSGLELKAGGRYKK